MGQPPAAGHARLGRTEGCGGAMKALSTQMGEMDGPQAGWGLQQMAWGELFGTNARQWAAAI